MTARIGRAHAAGLTLVEVLVVSALVLVIGGALITVFLTGQASYLSADAYVQVQQEARRAMDVMVRELREADVSGPTVADTQVLNFQLALGYNLNAQMPSCPANEVCWGARDLSNAPQPGWSIRYRVSGTQLLREILNAGGAVVATRVLANQVDRAVASTAFSWNTATRTVNMRLRILVQNSRLPGGRQATGILTSQVRLRNS